MENITNYEPNPTEGGEGGDIRRRELDTAPNAPRMVHHSRLGLFSIVLYYLMKFKRFASVTQLSKDLRPKVTNTYLFRARFHVFEALSRSIGRNFGWLRMFPVCGSIPQGPETP